MGKVVWSFIPPAPLGRARLRCVSWGMERDCNRESRGCLHVLGVDYISPRFERLPETDKPLVDLMRSRQTAPRQAEMEFMESNSGPSASFDMLDRSRVGPALTMSQIAELEQQSSAIVSPTASTTSKTFWQGHPTPLVILFTYHAFLSGGGLSSLSPTTYQSLEDQGCFHIPQKHLLDEFVGQYFLYVHPFLPMVDQDAFCRRYRGEQGANTYSTGIPLLYMRALIFATCHLVPPYVIQSLGFASSRECRANLYHRAKLLYDSNSEPSTYWRCQSALLLTFWVPRTAEGEERANTNWLAVAIRQAKILGAHEFTALPDKDRKRIPYKKLWWCCIVRDRILSMGLRRDLQIGHHDFDFDAGDIMLTESELQDGSDSDVMMYHDISKSLLPQITVRFLELCRMLTDLLDKANTDAERIPDLPGRQEWSSLSADMALEMKERLLSWYQETSSQLPWNMLGEAIVSMDEGGRNSVLLHTYIMYMYYFSAIIYLGDREVSHLLSTTPEEVTYTFWRSVNMRTHLDDIWNSITKYTKCMNEIMQLGLAKFLPISLVAFTTKPLALHILFVRAQQDLKYPCKAYGQEAAEKQEELNVLIKAMKMFRENFDGVESVSAIIRQANEQAQLGEVDEPYNATRFWAETLSSSPDVYARLTATIDLSFGEGRVLRSNEMPVKL